MVTNRLPRLLPTALDQEQRNLYDAILGGPRAGQVNSVPPVDDDGRPEGPFNAFLVAPAVGHPLQAVGAALRYGTELPDRFREVAILVVAAKCS